MKRVVMKVLCPCVAGPEVHQSLIVACRRRLLNATQVMSEVEKFGISTRELWLAENATANTRNHRPQQASASPLWDVRRLHRQGV